MPSPFPGMDPYLEYPPFWPSVHHNLIHYIQADLQPQLLPRYVVSIEERVFLEPVGQDRIPDAHIAVPREPIWSERDRGGGVAVALPEAALALQEPEWIPAELGLEIHEGYIEILDIAGNEVVTVIEVLSPSNKTPGPGHDVYRAKQQEVLCSPANLVEIDLLRQGLDSVAAPILKTTSNGRVDYIICTRRTARPGGFEVVRFTVRDPLPLVAIPLRTGESDVVLHLPEVFARCYDVGAYAYRVDYTKDPAPSLSSVDAAWAVELLRGRVLRTVTD